MAAEVGFAIYDGHIILATFIGLLGAVGGGFVMNTAILFTQPWGGTGLDSFRMTNLTKFGILFSLMYVLEISGIVFMIFLAKKIISIFLKGLSQKNLRA